MKGTKKDFNRMKPALGFPHEMTLLVNYLKNQVIKSEEFSPKELVVGIETALENVKCGVDSFNQKVPPLLTLKKSIVLWQGEFFAQVVDEVFDEEFAEEFRNLFSMKHRNAPYRVIPNKIENIPDVVQEAANWWAYAIQSPKTVKWEVRQFSIKDINQFKDALVREIMYDFEGCDCCFLDSCTEAIDILIESGVNIGLKVNDLPIDVNMIVKKEAVSLVYNSSRGGNFTKIWPR